MTTEYGEKPTSKAMSAFRTRKKRTRYERAPMISAVVTSFLLLGDHMQYTQADLARMIDCDKMSISFWKNGRNQPSRKMLARMVFALRTHASSDIDFFLRIRHYLREIAEFPQFSEALSPFVTTLGDPVQLDLFRQVAGRTEADEVDEEDEDV